MRKAPLGRLRKPAFAPALYILASASKYPDSLSGYLLAVKSKVLQNLNLFNRVLFDFGKADSQHAVF